MKWIFSWSGEHHQSASNQKVTVRQARAFISAGLVVAGIAALAFGPSQALAQPTVRIPTRLVSNPSFEAPVIATECSTSQLYFASQNDTNLTTTDSRRVPGWNTTDGATSNFTCRSGTYQPIELFNNTTIHGSASDGIQFAELNAETPSRLYQNVCLVSGESVGYSFAHKARRSAPNIEAARAALYSSAGTIITGTGTGATDYATSTSAWNAVTGTLTNGTTTGLVQFGFEALNGANGTPGGTGTGALNEGNLIDNVRISIRPLIDLRGFANASFAPTTNVLETAGTAYLEFYVNGVITATTNVININKTGGSAVYGTRYTFSGATNRTSVTYTATAAGDLRVTLGPGDYDPNVSTGATAGLIRIPITVNTTAPIEGAQPLTYAIEADSSNAKGGGGGNAALDIRRDVNGFSAQCSVASPDITLTINDPSTISGTLYLDDNRNSSYDPTTTPDRTIPAGVPLQLVDGSGNVVGTTTSVANGAYSFTNVAPGTYTVRVDPAAPTTALGFAKPVAPASGQLTGVVVTNGSAITNQNIGYDVPRVDVVKSTGAPSSVSGTPNAYDIPFTVTVANRAAAGGLTAPNVQANDSLKNTFSSGSPTIAVSGLTATGVGGATCTVNAAFNGDTNTQLLSGGNSLAPQQACTITFTARVTYPSVSSIPTTAQNNTAYGSAASGAGPNPGYTFPGGTPTPPSGTNISVSTDASTNGSALPSTPNGDTPSPTPIAFPSPPPPAGSVCATAGGLGRGANIFANNGSFGVLPGTPTTTPPTLGGPLPAGRTTYNYVTTSPQDGEYNITNSITYRTDGAWHSAMRGHTTGTANDLFMMVNASFTPGVFYEETINVTPNTNYEYSFWVMNVIANGAPILPDVNLEIERVGGSSVVVATTGNVPNSSTPKWLNYGGVVNSGSATQIIVRFRNNAPGGGGNDLALDDLVFAPCVLPVGNISGTLYVDANKSGAFDPSDTRLGANIPVQLVDSNGVVVATTTTDANGNYSFTGVPAKSGYTIKPTNTDPNLGNVGPANPSSGQITGVTVPVGGTVADQNFAYAPPKVDVIKSVGAPSSVAGTPNAFDIPFTITVANRAATGGLTAPNVQANDYLKGTFSSGSPTITVSSLSAAGAGGATCTVNTAFNGDTNTQLLSGSNSLAPQQACTITFTARVTYPNAASIPGTQNNTAYASSLAGAGPNPGYTFPGGTPTLPTGTPLTLSTDTSTNGTTLPATPNADAPSPTPIAFKLNPVIGAAKAASASTVKADGSYDVTYSVLVKNLGDIVLQNVVATDDLNATFPNPATFNVTTVSGSGANGSFDGKTNKNLLSSGVNLNPGESRTITLVVNVKPGASNFGPFSNTVNVTGTPPVTGANPNPTPVTDVSNNGTNPNPSGDKDPNKPTENVPTPISFSPNPVIGTAKSASSPVLQADGSYLVTYTVLVKNYGNTVLNGAQATDNLNTTYPAPTTFSVTSVSGSGANGSFNGAANQNLLTSGVTLNPGDSRTVTFTVRIVPNGAFGPFNNSVTATGTPPTGPAVTDTSNNGSNPNPSGDGQPNKPSENAPTPVNLNPNPVIGTAKTVSSGPTRMVDGSYDITYSVVVQNYGNVTLNNVTANDDLTQTFQSPATFTVKSVSGTGANASFNGSSNQNLLASGSSLSVGQSRTVQFTVNVKPNGSFGPFDNSVFAQGTAPATIANPTPTPVTDLSNDGTNPNPSGDNVPNKPSENAPTTVSLAPNPVIGTAKSVSAAIRQADGSYNLTYTVLVRNYGNTVLDGVQATDNLASTFPSPATFTVSSVTGTDSNVSFNGSSNKNLLAAGVSLDPDETRTITFNVNIKPNSAFGPFDNTVLASGTPPATTANPNPSAVTDLSTDGTNPDPNGNGDPTQSGENAPTRTSLTPNPVIGTAKAASAAIRQANGSYTLTYTVVVQNYGNIRLENVSATDNLALTFPSPTTFTVSNVTGSGANAGFNGVSDKNLLGTGIALEPGESRTITYTVNVAPNGAFGPFDNSVLATGATPASTPGGSQTVTDTSNDGTNPNPSGDSNPTKPSENNPTRVSFTPNPVIGTAKSASAAALQPDGSYVITYNVLIQNYGNVALSGVQGTDDLVATFPAPATFTVTGVSGTNANPNFNGSSDKTLLGTGVTLEPGESKTVTFSVNVQPNGNFGPFNNNVIAKGTPPGAPPVTDVSDNSNSGLNPDPNGNGDPTEPGENNPTVVSLTPKPVIGVAKAASTSGVQADGSYNITYTVLVKNYGNSVLYGAQATDDLSATFPLPATFTVSSVTGTDANPGFNGVGNKNLLKDGIALNPGESRTVTLKVNLKPGVNNLGPFNNSALASGTPPSTNSNPNPTPVTDVSNNGTDPDPSGNGDPTQATENKPTPVNLAPNPVIGTAKAAGPALLQPNGSYNVAYTVVVKNYGNVTLTNAQATDDLLQTFPSPATFLTSGVAGTGANLGFNGAADKNLLSAGVTLAPGDSRTVTFTVNIVPNGVFGPFNNTVLATGTGPAVGGNPPQTVSDRSTDGTNPNPSGDGDPTKPSENKPTPVSLAPKPVIGTAKAVSAGPTLNNDGSFDVSFVVYVKNYGNTVLNNATANDDLSAAFPSPATFTVTGITGTGANGSFNGVGNKNLLAAGTTLAVGESRRIAFTVKVTPNGNYGPFNNAVIAQGTAPAVGGNPAQTVSDRSNDDPNFNKTSPTANPNPDPNGNNDPTELNENNPTPINVNPVPLAQGKLRLTKTVGQPVAKAGEPLTYTLEATNESSVPMLDLKLEDVLPFGLIYRAGSSLVGGQAIEPTVTKQADAKGRQVQRLVWSVPGALAPGGKVRVQFAVNVTPLVPEGDLVNTATASAFGGQVKSNGAAAAVKIDLGVFTNNIVIVGRVYFDANDNNSYEAGTDTPLPGARVYLSDGRFAVTDPQGRYSIPNVTPGLYAVRLDPLTAPYAPKPVPDDQGQRGTRYVRPGIGGGIDNEDFPLYPSKAASVKSRSTTVSRGAVTLVKTLAQGGAGYAIQITLSIDKPVANLSLTDPLPPGAIRGPVTLVGANGNVIPVTVQDGKILIPGTLEPGKYTLTYAIFTGLPPEQVVTDPDINYDEVVR